MDDTDDFRERIRQSFGRQPAMETIGAELTRIEQAMVEVTSPTTRQSWLVSLATTFS